MEEKVDKEIVKVKENTKDDIWYNKYKKEYFLYIQAAILALLIIGPIHICTYVQRKYFYHCEIVSKYFPRSVPPFNSKLVEITALKHLLIPTLILIILGIYFMPCRVKDKN